MKVKEVAEFLKVTTEELLKLLKNVSVGKSYTEDSEIEKDLEKKLAKRYGVPYPFKSKPKAPAKPAQPEAKAPVKAQPKAEPAKDAKQGGQKQAPKPKSEPAKETKQGGQKQPPKPKAEPAKDAKQGGQKQAPKQKAEPAKENKQNAQKQAPKAEPQKQNKPRPSDIPSYKDEIVETVVDEEFLDKYDEFLQDNQYQNGQNTKIKQKVRTNEKVNKKPKQQKSRAEKLAGSIEQKKEDHVLYYELNMTVMDVADALGINVTDLVKKLFTSMGIFASATQTLDRDTIELIAMEYDFEVKDKQITDLIRFDEIQIEDDENDLESRPAIVTIMGHVDHGKTTLLDTIRSSHVVRGEAGGITQHIGAYQVQKDGRLITFIDTPGHAAFTEMRARGAQVTDIVILVVAADDGMMPQTKEAIEHAQAAGVPIIVAINKMDKPTANPDRVKQELMSYNLIAEEWGGDTIFVPISALTGKGVDDLLEMVILVSDMKEFKANPNRLAVGTVIEARLDKGRGPVATLLVQNGTLRVGDNIVVGTTYGRIRAMQDELGKIVKVAGPAKPVEITGIADVPFAGEKFMALEDERKARAIAEVRAQNKFNEEIGANRAASLNDIMSEASGELKVLNLIIKCDVQGSIEAIRGLVDKIQIEGTKINIISARVGGVTDNDISLAIASRAIIVGFNIRPTSQISDLAKEKKVEIRLYNIIYKLQEDIEKAAKGMLDPVFEEKITGEAEVRELFKISRIGTIAGSMVTKGEIRRGGSIRVIRDSIVVYTGKIAGLRRFKDDVKEVKEGYDCGITIEHYNDIKVGDRLECFVMEETERE
jgi:translation initiation factor IF-2